MYLKSNPNHDGRLVWLLRQIINSSTPSRVPNEWLSNREECVMALDEATNEEF